MRCFYHAADLDGHCSGAIVKRAYPECEMIGINYGDSFPWEQIKDETVFMVDFSLQPFSDMERLQQNVKSFIWIDHHKTALDEAEQHGFCVDGEQIVGIGACQLTWEYLNPGKLLPIAVYLLSKYDVWNHDDSRALPFQYGFRMFENTLPENQELWEEFLNSRASTYDKVCDVVRIGNIVLKYEQQQNEKYCKTYAFETRLTDITGRVYHAVCVNKGFTNSKVFDSVYDSSRHDLMITFCRLKPPAHKWTVSLYSDKAEIDCGVIARGFGGGGHKGAAGMQVSELPFAY